MTVQKCGANPANPEYSMCGTAFDACAVDDSIEGELEFATKGQIVTCQECEDVIRAVREKFQVGVFTVRAK